MLFRLLLAACASRAVALCPQLAAEPESCCLPRATPQPCLQGLDGLFEGHPTLLLYTVMICCPLLMNICQARGGAVGVRRGSPWAADGRAKKQRVAGAMPPSSPAVLLGAWAKVAGPGTSPSRCCIHASTFPVQVLIQDLVLKWRSAKGAGGDDIDGGPTLAERLRSVASLARSPGRSPGLASVGERVASLAKLGGSRDNVAEREASLLGGAGQRSDAPA